MRKKNNWLKIIPEIRTFMKDKMIQNHQKLEGVLLKIGLKVINNLKYQGA